MAEIRYDDREIVEALNKLASGLRDMKPVFDSIGAAGKSSAKNRFRTKIGPDGARWPESGRALREGGETMKGEGGLRDSINWSADNRHVEIFTSVVYAAILHFGGKTKPHTIKPKHKKALAWPGGKYPVKEVHHPGSNIPPRPFLGIDDDDKAEILDILTRHLGAQ